LDASLEDMDAEEEEEGEIETIEGPDGYEDPLGDG
jgi:hypothetical protein